MKNDLITIRKESGLPLDETESIVTVPNFEMFWNALADDNLTSLFPEFALFEKYIQYVIENDYDLVSILESLCDSINSNNYIQDQILIDCIGELDCEAYSKYLISIYSNKNKNKKEKQHGSK